MEGHVGFVKKPLLMFISKRNPDRLDIKYPTRQTRLNETNKVVRLARKIIKVKPFEASHSSGAFRHIRQHSNISDITQDTEALCDISLGMEMPHKLPINTGH